MITISNTTQAANALVAAIIKSGHTPIFDLDGVIFDATHRQHIFNKSDVLAGRCTKEQVGQLDLSKYRANTTAEQVAQDKDLPLIAAIHMLNNKQIPYHVATARVVTKCQHSSKLLSDRGIRPQALICRNGDTDKRGDSKLKVDELVKRFDKRQLENMVLIDDSLGNCKAVNEIGVKSIHVPFKGF